MPVCAHVKGRPVVSSIYTRASALTSGATVARRRDALSLSSAFRLLCVRAEQTTIPGLLLCLMKLHVRHCQQETLFYTLRFLKRLRALWDALEEAQSGSNVKLTGSSVDHHSCKRLPGRTDQRPGRGHERIGSFTRSGDDQHPSAKN